MNSLRDTPIGQLLRATGFKSHLLFPEEQEGFGPKHVTVVKGGSETHEAVASEHSASDTEKAESGPNGVLGANDTSTGSSLNLEKLKSKDGDNEALIVDWYDDKDPANPRNWSIRKKTWVTVVICFYTFVVYGASSIIVPANGFIRAKFGVGEVTVLLTLSMYVVGYGLGPMLFSPLSEIAYVGRNPPYLFSFAVYFIISIILAAVANQSFAGLIVLRVLQAFFGSPILASGGASVDDIWSREVVPYFYVPWVVAMYGGPASEYSVFYK
jgi:MFS transporter, DHA1 family, multidrug resistance protein